MEFKRRQPERFLVILDDGAEILFSPEICLKFQFAPNKSIAPEDFQEILFENDIQLAKDQGLKYLSLRPHSRHELIRKISTRGYAEPAIEAALNTLARVGLIDDKAFARLFIDNELRLRPCGRLLLREKLRQRGISQEISDPLLEEAFQATPEQDYAIAIAEKFVQKSRRQEYQQEREKLLRRLKSRAFGWDSIRPALKVLEEARGQHPADEDFSSP